MTIYVGVDHGPSMSFCTLCFYYGQFYLYMLCVPPLPLPSLALLLLLIIIIQ